MRISEDRYSRDRQRLDIALRFIQHEARTQTIRRWTGLTDDRIRKLYHSYLREPRGTHGGQVARHRGKSPQQSSFFTRTARLRQDTALLASLYRLVGALPTALMSDAPRVLPGVNRGELLCQAYEVYRQLSATPAISFEHAVFLLTTLAGGKELSVHSCRECGCLMVVDGLCLRQPHCVHCAASDGSTMNC